MMATANSRTSPAIRWKFIAGMAVLAAGIIFADDAQRKVFTARAKAEFQRAESKFKADASNSTNVWQFARAAFDLAEFATTDTDRAALAGQGIAACRQLIARDQKSAAAHYYLAMNLGQLAKAEAPSIASYKLVKDIEREFKAAAELDARFDYAGPERNLGKLYHDAPGWPISVGNKRTSRYYSEQAIRLVPDYPGNRLNLVESYLQWNDREAAERELKALDAIWPVAQTNLTGERWEQSWGDWSVRREAARKKTNEASHQK
jgi:hypothetical protein